LTEVTESDFHQIKNEQNLLIDYNSFVTKYFELLKMCMIQKDQYTQNSTFKLSLNLVNNYEYDLKVLECNNFRQICHI